MRYLEDSKVSNTHDSTDKWRFFAYHNGLCGKSLSDAAVLRQPARQWHEYLPEVIVPSTRSLWRESPNIYWLERAPAHVPAKRKCKCWVFNFLHLILFQVAYHSCDAPGGACIVSSNDSIVEATTLKGNWKHNHRVSNRGKHWETPSTLVSCDNGWGRTSLVSSVFTSLYGRGCLKANSAHFNALNQPSHYLCWINKTFRGSFSLTVFKKYNSRR